MTSTPVFRVAADKLGGSEAGLGAGIDNVTAIRLDGPEGRHAALVRRLQPGERVNLTDGAGRLAECVVRGAGSHGDPFLDLDVLELRALPRPDPRICVVQALAKGDRGELAVETMTEIGVDEIVPWSASRSITQWRGDRGEKALAKWRSTAAEASKQSRRIWWPDIAGLATTAQVAQRLSAARLAIVLHEEGERSLADLTPDQLGPQSGRPGDIVLIVGPEGGIGAEELKVFAEAGGVPYRMGPTVLRTSTAGTAAAAVLLARSGRW